jgi:hypothetical protein
VVPTTRASKSVRGAAQRRWRIQSQPLDHESVLPGRVIGLAREPVSALYRRGLNLHQPIRARSLYALSLGVVFTAVYGMLLINLRPMSAPGRETSVQPP